MRQAKQNDNEAILQFLKQDIVNNLYAYIDIKTYGIEHPHMKIWINNTGVIKCVVMKYYESFQICGKIEEVTEKLIALIAEYTPKMISGSGKNIKILESYLGQYKASYGKVFEVERLLPQMGNGIEVESATEEDMGEIAALICSDAEIGGHYDKEILAEQLRNRLKTGMGRNFIIRNNGTIVAHTATYAESEGIAVTGGTIVAKEFRDSFYYAALSNKLLQELMRENKKIYTFSISDKMIRYHTKMHKICAEYGKLTYKSM